MPKIFSNFGCQPGEPGLSLLLKWPLSLLFRSDVLVLLVFVLVPLLLLLSPADEELGVVLFASVVIFSLIGLASKLDALSSKLIAGVFSGLGRWFFISRNHYENFKINRIPRISKPSPLYVIY